MSEKKDCEEEFNLTINDKCISCGKFIGCLMKQYDNQPSLIIYAADLFEEEDKKLKDLTLGE